MQKRIFTQTELAILRRNRLKNMDFSVRIFRTLFPAAGINTLGQLLQYSESDILGFKYMTIRVVEELREELRKIGLTLMAEEQPE